MVKITPPQVPTIQLQVKKQVQKNSFLSYVLSDQVDNKVVFELLQKLHLQIYASQFITS